MLVLTRKAGESIRIGSDVCVRVVGVSGGQVRIGIEAPAVISVHREEVYLQIEQANQASAGGDVDLLNRWKNSGSDGEE